MIQQVQNAVQSLAADDVDVGDFVVVMHVTLQYPSFLWCHEPVAFSRPEMIPLSWMPCDGGKPLEVIAVCIPFLLVERVDGTRETLDLRQCRIARTSPEFAKKVRKAHVKNKKQR
jgi:hypothetical protein